MRRLTYSSWMAIQQVRAWPRSHWRVAGVSYLAALLLMGVLGETLPGAAYGRNTPVLWWNYVTLALAPPLIGLIVATFVPNGQPRKSRRRQGAGAGLGGAAGTVAMACPVCNPIAIPLFGTAGVLSFLAPERGPIALLSVGSLGLTLLLRLRTVRDCQLKDVAEKATNGGFEPKGLNP
jgi:hypothetical protein